MHGRCRLCHWALMICVVLGLGAFPALAEDGNVESRREEWIALRHAKAARLEPEVVSGWERRFRNYEKRPWLAKLTVKGYRGVRVLLGGMPPSSGFVGGLGYAAGRSSDVALFDVQGRVSTKDFRRGEVALTFPGPARESPWHLSVQARYRDYPVLRFYGLAPLADSAESTFYAREDRAAGVQADYRTRFVEMGVGVGLLNVGIRSGDRDPQIGERFDASTIPGSSGKADWLHYRGDVAFLLLDAGYPRAGVILEVGADRYQHRDIEGFDFTRLRGEVQAHVPLGVRSRRLALRVRTAHDMPDGGSRVPFFLMETIGGATSLRGYEQYRFQNTRNLLFNLEYRWEIWTFADMTVFTDAGKTFARERNFSVRDLKSTWGLGLRLHSPIGAPFRIEYAKAGGQYKIHMSTGPDF